MKWVFDRADDAVKQLSKEPINQEIIYCNLDRITPDKKKPKDYFRDNDLGGIPIPTKSTKSDGTVVDVKKLFDAVKSSNPFKGGDEARVEAFTLSIPEDDHTNFANQITIAPWYRDLCLSPSADQSKGFKIKIAINKWKANKQKWLNRQIDAYADFRVLLLHEMAHTLPVGLALGLKADNPVTNDDIGYGWNKIINGRRDHADTAILNADNYAYFGMILNFMKDAESPQKVDKQGDLQSMAQAIQKLVRKFIKWIA
ncbi:MAG: hypothetical protein Q9160_004408 [Pyrenula sp. 1 TL-2023]